MTDLLIAVVSAFWLGILTSISPCPLATNIAAISYVGRKVTSTSKVFLTGQSGEWLFIQSLE
jgi:cytochrome c-type biogenesis protein